uniref:Mitochondrial import inner membrane translocase subunit Tim21 n=1 Tax=Strigamia maritima TaxID=126957 RepID=T1J544_STRMM
MAASTQYTRMIKAVRSFITYPSSYSVLLRDTDQVVSHSLLLRCYSGSRVIVTCRYFSLGPNLSQEASQSNHEKRDTTAKAITEAKSGSYGQLTLGGKVKQAGKDAYYTGIVVLGVGITGLMFYAIFRELFSKTSPNSIYTQAYKLCCKHPRVIALLGEPIKGYGELSGRGRRRHVSHLEYVKDGVNYMRMKFYIEGSLKKATVHLEVMENSSGRYDFRYLFVDLNEFPPETIIIEDNRHITNVVDV